MGSEPEPGGDGQRDPPDSAAMSVLHVDPDPDTRERVADHLETALEACSVESVPGDGARGLPDDAGDCVVVGPDSDVDWDRLAALAVPVVLYADSASGNLPERMLAGADAVVERGDTDGDALAERVGRLIGHDRLDDGALVTALARADAPPGGDSGYFLVDEAGAVQWASRPLASLFPVSGVDVPDGGFDDYLGALVAAVSGAERVARRPDAGTPIRYLTLPVEGETRHYRRETHAVEGVGDGLRLEVVADVTGAVDRTDQLEQFQSLVEGAEDGFYTLDDRGVIEFCNDSFAAMLGYEPAELVGRNIESLVDERAREQGQTAIETLLSDDDCESLVLDTAFQHREGGDVDVSLHMTLRRSETGAYEGVVCVARDVTERKERIRELQRYETLVNAAQDPMFAVGPDDTFTLANDAFLELVGLSREEVVGESPSSVLATSDVQTSELVGSWQDAYGRLGVTGRDETEYEVEVTADEERVFEGNTVLLDDQAGSSVTIFRDVTERKRRERELAETRDRMELALDAMGATVWEADLETGDVRYNPSSQLHFGTDVDGFQDALDQMHPDDREQFLEAWETGKETGEYGTEFRVVDGDDVRWVSSQGRFVFDGDGEPIRAYGVGHDVTERKRRERALERERDKLARLETVVTSIQPLTEEMAQATTREGLEQAICDSLADSEAYASAWIGSSVAGDRLQPRVASSLPDDYFEGVDFGTEPRGLVEAALEAGEPQVVDDVFAEDARHELPDKAEQAGYRSGAVVPLTYRSTTYGVLAVYCTEPDSFTEQEVRVLEGLGQRIGHALSALENRRLLQSEVAVELRFRSTAPDHPLMRVAGACDCTLRMENFTRTPDGDSLFHVTVEGGDAEAIAAEIADIEGVAFARTLRSDRDRGLVQFRYVEPNPVAVLVDNGAVVRSAICTPAEVTVVADAAPQPDTRSIAEAVTATSPGFELVSRRERDLPEDSLLAPQSREVYSDLTQRQREVLEAAYHAGYYEWPRDTTAEELADALDIAAPTLHQHFRRAHANLVGALVDETGISVRT